MAGGKDWEPVWKDGAGWCVDFSVEGVRFRRRLGIRDKGLKAIARAKALNLYKSAWSDVLDPAPSPAGVPFYVAAKGYVDDGGEARFLPPIITHFGADTMCHDIGEVQIAEAAQAIYPGRAPDTHRRQVRVPIRAVLRWQAGERRRPSTDNRRVRWLTPEEAERLIEAAAALTLPRHSAPERYTLQKIAFLLGSGARTGECLAAEVADWNPQTRQWWLPGVETGASKTQLAARFVRLPQKVVDLIGDLPDVGRAFLTPYGKPYQLRRNGGGQMAEAFGKARAAAGLGPDVTPHVLRHTWATWFYAQTRDPFGLQDQGGWAKADTVNRYRHLAPDDLPHRLAAYGWDFTAPAAPAAAAPMLAVDNTRNS